MQKGQSTVEFAFVVPFLVFLFLALIYGGMLFMDYIQYNNAARAIARDVAFSNLDEIKDIEKLEAYKEELKQKYFNPLTSLYEANLSDPKIDEDAKQVTVTISLNRTVHLGLFEMIKFPPANLKDIVYIMPIEKAE